MKKKKKKQCAVCLLMTMMIVDDQERHKEDVQRKTDVEARTKHRQQMPTNKWFLPSFLSFIPLKRLLQPFAFPFLRKVTRMIEMITICSVSRLNYIHLFIQPNRQGAYGNISILHRPKNKAHSNIELIGLYPMHKTEPFMDECRNDNSHTI